MKKIGIGILFLIGLTNFGTTHAQNTQQIDQIMNQMYPHMEKILTLSMTTYFETLGDSDSAEQLASFTKNYFDALVAKGFTKEEALQIVISVGTPVVPVAGGLK